MNKFIPTVIAIMLFSISAQGQKLVKNEKDKFTKALTKQTSKEKIWRNTALGGLIDVYAQSIDNSIYLWLVMHERSIFSISKGDALYIALDDGNSVMLECVSGDVASRGENLWHGTVGYKVTEEDYNTLIMSPANGVRIVTTGGYIEKTIKDKHKETIANCLKLVK